MAHGGHDNNNSQLLSNMRLNIIEILTNTIKAWLEIWKKQFREQSTLSLDFNRKLEELFVTREQLIHDGHLPAGKLKHRLKEAIAAINLGNTFLELDFQPWTGDTDVYTEDSILQLLSAHDDANIVDAQAKTELPQFYMFVVEFDSLQWFYNGDSTSPIEMSISVLDTTTKQFLCQTTTTKWIHDTSTDRWAATSAVIAYSGLEAATLPTLKLVLRLYSLHYLTPCSNSALSNGSEASKVSSKRGSKEKLKLDKKISDSCSPLKRPLACSVLSVVCGDRTAVVGYGADSDVEFQSQMLVEHLTQQQNNNNSDSKGAQALALTQKCALSLRMDVVPGLEKDAVDDNEWPSGIIHIPPLLNYSCAGNKVLMCLHSADFDKSWKDVEVTMEVVHSKSGAVLKGVYHHGDPSNGDQATFEWTSSAVQNCPSPKWREQCLIDLDQIADHEGSCSEFHLRFLVRLLEKSKERRLAAMAFFPLVGKERLILPADGFHCLTLYKCDLSQKLTPVSRYLCLEWNKEQLDLRNGKLIANSSSLFPLPKLCLVVHVNTYTSSYTHSGNLLPFCRENTSLENIIEVIPFLSAVDDAALMPCATVVVKRCLTLLGRFAVDSQQQFSKILVTAILNVMARCYDNKVSLRLEELLPHYAAIKVIFNEIVNMLTTSSQRLIDHNVLFDGTATSVLIAEYLCYSSTPTVKTAEVYQSLTTLFSGLGTFLASETTEKLKVRTWEVVNKLPQMKCMGKFAPIQRARLLIAILEKTENAAESQLVFHERFRLDFATCMHDSMKHHNGIETLFLYFKPFVLLIRYHLKRRSHLESTTLLLSEMLRQISDQTIATNRRLIRLLVKGALEFLVACCLLVERSDKIRVRLLCCLFEVLRLMSYREYAMLLELLRKSNSNKRLKDFLLRLFLIIRNIVRTSPTEPPNITVNSVGTEQQQQKSTICCSWRSLYLALCNASLLALQELSDALCVDFLEEMAFDKQLWTAYLVLCTNFVQHSSLQIENMLKPNYEKTMSRYGDMRLTMAFQLCALWKHLDKKQSFFISSMISPFVDISMIAHSELRQVTIPLVLDLLAKSDWENTKEIEYDILEKIDTNAADGKADSDYVLVLKTVMNEKIKKLNSASRENCMQFVSKAERLMMLRMALNAQSDDGLDGILFTKYESLFGLVTFYEQQYETSTPKGRASAVSQFVHYVDLLRQRLLENGRYAEAAAALRLYADRLQWTPSTRLLQPLNGHFPEQTEVERKTLLYTTIIHYYKQANVWSQAILLAKELVTFYETIAQDYDKLAETLRNLASLFETAATASSDSSRNPYFRIEFMGRDFPDIIKGRKLIYRGQQYDSITTITEMLRMEWPAIQVNTRRIVTVTEVRATQSVPSDLRVALCLVKPEVDNSKAAMAFGAADALTAFTYSTNASTTGARLSRALSSDADALSRAADFQNLWTRRQCCVVNGAFPSVLPYLDVVAESSEMMSPVQTACSTVNEKNTELRGIVQRKSNSKTGMSATDVQRLLMVLQGAIEAAVNGGIDVYQQAFFTADFCLKNPTETPALIELRILLWNQAELLEQGLNLARGTVAADCEPLLNHLTACFAKMKQKMKASLDSPSLKRFLNPLILTSGNVSQLSSPDQSSISAVVSCPPTTRCQRFSLNTDWSSWSQQQSITNDSGIIGSRANAAFDSESIYDNDASFCYESEEEPIARNSVVALRLQRRSKMQRPMSYNWESSVESVPPKEKHDNTGSYCNLSDSNTTSVLLRKVPGPLRKLANRFSSSSRGMSVSRSCDRRSKRKLLFQPNTNEPSSPPIRSTSSMTHTGLPHWSTRQLSVPSSGDAVPLATTAVTGTTDQSWSMPGENH